MIHLSHLIRGSTALLPGLRIAALFNGFQFYKKRLLELLIFNPEILIPVPYSSKAPS